MKFACIAAIIAICAIAVHAADLDQKIIPVATWPRVLNVPGKQIINPTPAQCVAAGYRLIDPKPAAPEGKLIASGKIIQDPSDPARAIYDITYIDAPDISPAAPVALTNITADRVRFTFTTTGVLRAVIWMDAPVTNGVVKQ